MAVLGAAVMSSMAKQAAAATTNEDMETALRALYDATDGPNWTNKVSVHVHDLPPTTALGGLGHGESNARDLHRCRTAGGALLIRAATARQNPHAVSRQYHSSHHSSRRDISIGVETKLPELNGRASHL